MSPKDKLQRATLQPVPEQHYMQHEDSANESGQPQGSKARGETNSTLLIYSTDRFITVQISSVYVRG